MGDGGSSKEDLLISYFHEVPITAPAYAAIVVFAVVGLIALLITIRTRAWFMLVVTITAWLEVLGFGFRLQTIHSPAQGSYIGEQLGHMGLVRACGTVRVGERRRWAPVRMQQQQRGYRA